MASRHVFATSTGILIASMACGSKDRPLGRIEDVQRRAEAMGCHLKWNVSEARCEVLVGPCNCRLSLFISGNVAGSDEQPRGKLLVFGAWLQDCPKSQSLAPLWQILDPMFDSDEDRNRLHNVIANPPLVKGAASDARTKLATDIGPLRAEISWEPQIWDALKVPDPSLAEFSIDVGLASRVNGHPDEVSTTTNLGHRDYPSLCRDGRRRPWAERPLHPPDAPE